MREGWAPTFRGTAASRRLPALFGALAGGFLVAALLTLQPALNAGTPWNGGCLISIHRWANGSPEFRKHVRMRTHFASCGREPHADVAWIQGPQGRAGGNHTCTEFNKVCLDQGAFVMYDERYSLVNGSHMPTFDLRTLEVRPLPPAFGIGLAIQTLYMICKS
jgi:hypothetical protein